MTYGWADQILQPMMGVNYYEAVVAKNGKSTDDFVRLFMVPGMAHCGGGIGPDRNDAVTAVIDWVEKGKAPDQLLASKVTNGQSCARARSARIRRSRATRARAASTTRRTSAASRQSNPRRGGNIRSSRRLFGTNRLPPRPERQVDRLEGLCAHDLLAAKDAELEPPAAFESAHGQRLRFGSMYQRCRTPTSA